MGFFRRSAKRKSADAHKVAREERLDALTATAEQTRMQLDDLAYQTKEIAEDITLQLRSELIDKMRELELTSNIISDALLLCDRNGLVLTMNSHAENLLQCDTTTHMNIYQHLKVIGNFWETLIEAPEDVIVLRSDGAELDCSVAVSRMEKLDGTINYIVLLHVREENETTNNMRLLTKGTMLVSNGIIVGANREMESALGYEPNGLLSYPLINIIAESDRAFVGKHLEVGEMETTFDTVLVHHNGTRLYAKMAISFIEQTMVVTIEGIGEDVGARTVDVIRVFGEDFFFRSSTYISPSADMFMYLTPDFRIKYVNEQMKNRLVCTGRDLTGKSIEDVMSMTESKIALLHFQSLSPEDAERSVSIHLTNSNGESYQEWTDRAFYDENGNVMEYRRSGIYRS